jgi:hypothetical protein
MNARGIEVAMPHMRRAGKASSKPEPLEGRYSNTFQVGYNAFEFVIDLGQLFAQGQGKPRFHTRIVTSPLHAKAFLNVLQRSVTQYEQQFGTIASEDE